MTEPTDEELAALRTEFGITSNGRGIREFTQVIGFARAVLAKWGTPQPAPADLEQLRERISKMGLDVDRAMRGHVNEQSPLGTQRLAAIAALAKPAPAPLSDDTALLDGLARLNWYVGPGDFYCDEAGGMNDYDDKNYGPEELRQAIRAALAAQGDTP